MTAPNTKKVSVHSASVGDYTAPVRTALAEPAMPWKASLLLGAGTLVVGAVAPLYDSYVPQLLQRHLSSSTGVGAAMGIDNVLALLVVPLIGALSDGTHTRLGRRLPFVLAALPLTAMALAVIPLASGYGLFPLLAAMIVLDVALAVWRAPFGALLAELVPSVHRSRTEGILGVAMCLGAMLVLGTARKLSALHPTLPFFLAGGLVAIVWLVHCAWLREPPHEPRTSGPRAAIAPFRSLRDAFTARKGTTLRFFAACLFFQMAFQSFSSWFTLHGSERFHTTVGDVSLGFIAVAVATLIGSMPAGWLGARYGRRRMSLIGIGGMAISCLVLHVVPTLSAAVGVLFLFGLSWAFPVANLTPMALELGTAARAGSLAGAFLLVQSVAGVIGPSAAGLWFDVTDTKRSLFLLLALFLTGAFVLLATLSSGFGEAGDAVLS
jgi:maltose/moltooligosaccharide transporter